MIDLLKQVEECAAFLSAKNISSPIIGVVLGTGLSSLITDIEIEKSFPYVNIPHFPAATVEFHKGQLIYGSIEDKKILIMQGRYHYYEGYTMQQITFPIRVMRKLGIENLFLSNAAGGINNNFKKRELVLIDDHINLLPENPLRGLNDAAFGNRFVDMCSPYDTNLNEKLNSAANRLSISLKKGIYAAVPGPNLETRAEYRYIKSIGADMVGMSTVPEVIVANHIGLKCAAISVITDECDPDNLQPVDISEIIKVAAEVDNILSRLLVETIKNMK